MKLFIQFILFALTALVFDRCSNSIPENQLVGSWGYLNPLDTTYEEIYFTREFLVHNFNSVGIRGVNEYVLSRDSVYLMPGRVLYFKVLDAHENKILIRNLDGIDLTMERLPISDESFRAFCISEGRKAELQTGRMLRGSEFLLRKGFKVKEMTDMDSIILIPTPEK